MTQAAPEFGEWLGVKYKTLLAGSETAGGISITQSISPAMSGPPRHIHHREDETFYLLSGQCVFWLDGTIYRKSAGEAMFIPRGVVHTFRIPGDVPCDHLTIMSPGGFEGFFAAMVAGQYRMPEDMSRVAEIAGRFDMSFTGPPLAEADIQL